jgi:CRP/FNR family cyclic AMP-dependent transcriptional regulator
MPTDDPGPEPLAPGTFFAKLRPDEREQLEPLAARRRFENRSVLMYQDEPDERVMILTHGRVKVHRYEDDRELLLSLRDPGDVLGELAFIDNEPRIATVTALEAGEALVMPAARFRTHLEQTPRVAVALLETVAHRLREATVGRSQLAASDTLGRLATRVLELADRYGEPAADGVRIVSPLSQEDLAAWVGSSRAGVAQAFQTMRELGWVATTRGEILVIDAAALIARAA